MTWPRDATAVSYLYSLYDALISIAVPADKARAVVDAMEHDMGTMLATKPDLENLRLATKSDLENQRLATKSDLDSLRSATRQDLELLRKDLQNQFVLLDQKIDGVKTQLELKIDAQEFRMTVKLGSMMVVCFGLVLAALRAWT